MINFVLASNNKKKIAELETLFTAGATEAIKVVSLKDIGFTDEIIEDGDSFEENALIKAKTIAEICSLPTISDDSGLEVDALNGAPGVYTARFVSAVCLCMPDGTNTVCRGTCEGWIGYERIGDGGFGYDPVFMVGDISYSQMTPEAKDAISHRGSALRQLKEKIGDFI